MQKTIKYVSWKDTESLNDYAEYKEYKITSQKERRSC